jgi:MarR family transcriptional regulator, transcriptional regulator for hemolysin
MKGFFQRFITLYRPIINLLNELLGEFDLSYSLWQVMFFLKMNGPSSLVDISKYYEVEKPAITRRVQRLEKMSLVEVIPSQNKREKVIHLTDRGEEVYELCRKRITDLESHVMRDIPEEEQLVAFRLLPKIKSNILEGDSDEQS